MEIQQEEEEKVSSATELITSSEDAPVVRLANNILALAIKKGASDIHIEPQEKGVVLRFRIDGVLYVETILSKKIQIAAGISPQDSFSTRHFRTANAARRAYLDQDR